MMVMSIGEWNFYAKFFLLPFPYPSDKKPVERFAIDKNGFFIFMGRKEFKNILEKINELESGTGFMKLYVYGTIEYTNHKSHGHPHNVSYKFYGSSLTSCHSIKKVLVSSWIIWRKLHAICTAICKFM
jgi:hypothetical protein